MTLEKLAIKQEAMRVRGVLSPEEEILKRRKYQRERCRAKTKAKRIEKRAADAKAKRDGKAAKLEQRALKIAAKDQRAAARNAPSKTAQRDIDVYNIGLRAGFERGRAFERTQGRNAPAPAVI
jgi:hypothetical protein